MVPAATWRRKHEFIIGNERLTVPPTRWLTLFFAGFLALSFEVSALAAQGADGAGLPWPPLTIAPKDLPQHAQIGPEKVELVSDVDTEDWRVIGSLPAGAKVFVLQETETHAVVLAPAGQYGWVDRAALTNVSAARSQDFRRVADAIAKPVLQAKLEPAQQQLLQATFASWFAGENWGITDYTQDNAKMLRQELAALRLVRNRQLKLALPVLLFRWERRYLTDIGNRDYPYSVNTPYPVASEPHFLLRDLFPQIHDALGTADDMDRVLCNRFRKDDSWGTPRYTFGGPSWESNVFALSLIQRTHPDKPPVACLVTAIKKIAANNPVEQRGGYRPLDVPLAVELLKKMQSREQLEKWIADVAKQPMPHFGGNLAFALVLLTDVDVAPHAARLLSLVGQDNANDDDWTFAAKHMAMWALAKRAPSQRFDEALKKLVLNQRTAPLIRVDALRILSRPPAPTALLETLEQVFKEKAAEDSPPARVRQVAAELLASNPFRQAAMTTLQAAMADTDPYIRNIALAAVRNEALQAMKAARSTEARAKIRGQYLESLRKQVESLSSLPPDLEVKRSPLWMLKPQAQVSIQVRHDPELFQQGLPQLHIETPWEATPPPLDAPVPYPDSQSRIVEKFAVHPGKVLFKYGTSGGRKTLTAVLKLDELTLDGEDLVSRTQPGIYTVQLIAPGGEVAAQVAWYCEPDNAFWSETPFERQSSE